MSDILDCSSRPKKINIFVSVIFKNRIYSCRDIIIQLYDLSCHYSIILFYCIIKELFYLVDF